MRSILFRALLFLLITRVLAAPVALRPLAPTGTAGYSLVFRICNWPDQRHLSPREIVEADHEIGFESSSCFTFPRPTGLPPIPSLRPFPPALPLLSYVHRSLGAMRC